MVRVECNKILELTLKKRPCVTASSNMDVKEDNKTEKGWFKKLIIVFLQFFLESGKK